MGLIDKLFKKKSGDEKEKRLESTKKELVSFLDKVNAKYQHYTHKEYSSEEYDSFLEDAGKMFYTLLDEYCPESKNIIKDPTPINLNSKEKRDKKVCKIASKFLDFIEFVQYNKGIENMDYGIFGNSIQLGELTDQNKIFVQYNWKLPSEKLINLKNYSFKQACQKIKETISPFVGYISHSDISDEIIQTPLQMIALDNFRLGICKDINELVRQLPQKQWEREQGKLSKKAEENIRELPNNYISKFREGYEELMKLDIHESNISNETRRNVNELALFVAEKGKYQTQRMKNQEAKERLKRQTKLEQDRKDYETKIIIPARIAHHPTPKTGIFKDDFEEYQKTQTITNGNGKKTKKPDTSIFWKNKRFTIDQE